MATRQELAESMRKGYKKASKGEKAKMIDSLCRSCGYSRKHATVLLGGCKKVKQHKRKQVGRPPTYGDFEVVSFLIDLRRRTNMICSKRLKEIIPIWIDHCDFIKLNEGSKSKLLKISAATIDRIIKKSNSGCERIGFATTKPGTILKKQIKINTNQWSENVPGHIECDTVAHCGSSVSGDYVHSVNAVDIATLWIETRAIWNKTKVHTVNAIKSIEEALPFKLIGFDSDNGSEFINWHLKDYFDKRRKNRRVIFTRSREYKKNDNAHIEGRNWTHIRQYLGYGRFDDIRLVELLNDLYQNEWTLFFNYFIPSQKCVSKTRIQSKVKKEYDKPKTPYQRVLESEFVKQNVKDRLSKTYKKLNPYKLQKSLFDKIKIIRQISNEKDFEIAL